MPQVKGKGDKLNFTSCFFSRLFNNLFCTGGTSPCNPSVLQHDTNNNKKVDGILAQWPGHSTQPGD